MNDQSRETRETPREAAPRETPQETPREAAPQSGRRGGLLGLGDFEHDLGN